MLRKEARERIEKLKNLINHHRYLYHVLDKQEISDAALDSLKKELFDLETMFPDLITEDSPTQRVGGKPLKKFGKARHSMPMLSFNDAFSQRDVEDWLNRISRLLSSEEVKEIDFFCELKIDGLAIELSFENGKLKTGSTRGNGIMGEDITPNLKTIEAIPLKINGKDIVLEELSHNKVAPGILNSIKDYDLSDQIIVRGEAFISKKEFEAVNAERAKLGLTIYSNPRNLAAGSIRQLDPKVTMDRHLDSFAYDLVTDFRTETHEEKHNILKAFGFKTNAHNHYARNLSEVFDFYEKCRKIRQKIPYEIDGVVVIVNKNRIFNKLGVAGKAPRGAVAYKFPAKQSTTIVEEIKVQVGRTGALTPVAVLKPVEVGGVIVSRATLHNEDEIKRLGIRIGDTVIVSRAGDVIPDIIKVLPDLRTGKEREFKMPAACPICGSKTRRNDGEAMYYCTNPNCWAKEREYFYHFVSRQAFDIKGLGVKIIDRLLDVGLVSDPADIFELKEGDLIPLQRFAEKSARNLIDAIGSRKRIPLSRFIFALGIRNVGEKTAYDLSLKMKSIEKIKESSIEELLTVEDVGPVVANSIFNWFKNKKNLVFLDKLRKAGVIIKNQKPAKVINLKLYGKKFVLTGTLKFLTREEVKEKIKELGGETVAAVSKNTDYLLAGENPGSKLDKARKMGIRILSEKIFFDMIR